MNNGMNEDHILMAPFEKIQLIELSKAIRESTIKRLQSVPLTYENWRISKNAMSFYELTLHLIECDNWLFKKYENRTLKPILGKKEKHKKISRVKYLDLIQQLNQTGIERNRFLKNLSAYDLKEKIVDQRFGEVSFWWVIVRGNLDHEIHHRGQLATYLRVLRDRNLLK